MLPAGLVAQPADRADISTSAPSIPTAQTTVRLVVGGCSCDLVRPRHPDPREDERQHRDRSAGPAVSRDALIAALERHRRGAAVAPPVGGWSRALAAFVAEHARNAGDTLYLLRFSAPPDVPPLPPVRSVRVPDIAARPERWLEELVPTLVRR